MIYEKLRDLLDKAGLDRYTLSDVGNQGYSYENAPGKAFDAVLLPVLCMHFDTLYEAAYGKSWDVAVDADDMTATVTEVLGYTDDDAAESLRQIAMAARSMVFENMGKDHNYYLKLTVVFEIDLGAGLMPEAGEIDTEDDE